jgi:diguanylate cyclase (GGDEF)-like protein
MATAYMVSDEQDEQRDALNGLFNRRRFYGDLDSAVRDAGQIAYILADLDECKKVNDTYGHEVGNRILRDVAQIFATRCAASHSSFGPYRHGGEAFCVFLTDVDAEKTVEFAESLRAGVEGLRFDAHPRLRVTARLAAVTADLRGRDGDQRQRCQEYLLSQPHEAVYCHPQDKKHNEVVMLPQGD